MFSIKIVSTEIDVPSPAALVTIKLIDCETVLNDWITASNPLTAVSYDVRNPPSSDILARRTYSGPRLDLCGDPSISL